MNRKTSSSIMCVSKYFDRHLGLRVLFFLSSSNVICLIVISADTYGCNLHFTFYI